MGQHHPSILGKQVIAILRKGENVVGRLEQATDRFYIVDGRRLLRKDVRAVSYRKSQEAAP